MAFGANTTVTVSGREAINRRLLSNTAALPIFIGIGTGAETAARTADPADTALSTEVETRATGTATIQTTGTANDTYQVVGQITATATRSIDEAGLFDLSSSGNLTVSATFAEINLNSGDSLQLTFKQQLQ